MGAGYLTINHEPSTMEENTNINRSTSFGLGAYVKVFFQLCEFRVSGVVGLGSVQW
jgi:hypothetical protein